MPIFDYRCSDCDSTFEVVVLSQSEAVECPHCKSRALSRLASLTAPPARLPSLVRTARKQANAEGHFSHYSASERPKL